MVEYSIELAEKYKLSGSNFLDWNVRMKSILTFKKLYALATGTEDPETAAERDKLDPERQDLAFEIIWINCYFKIAAQFSAEANNDPMALLIDDKTIKPSTLLDSVVAMWTIRNLPEEYKTIGETWLKKCKIEKVTALLKDTIEEPHAYIVRTKDDDATKKALATQRNKNQSKPKAMNRCSNTYHNLLAQHSEEECWKIHPEKHPDFDKPVKALLAKKNSSSVSSFVLDSRATTSMVNQLEFFQSIEMKEQEIELADRSIIKALGCGTIQLEFQNIILTFSKTLYIPSLAMNLIRMTTFVRTYRIIKLLNKDEFEVIDKDKKQVVTRSLASGNLTLYYAPKVLTSSAIPGNILTLHQAAGHPSLEYFRKMFPKQNIPQFDCITCFTCKMTKSAFSGNFLQETRKLEFLHMDLCGQISSPSVSGAQYIFKVLDWYSHFAWTLFLLSKSETKSMLKRFIAKIERQSNNKFTNIISNNSTEFVNSELQEFFKQKGISHLTTAPYTAQQNPFSERGNQTTINKARCLLKDSGMDPSLWAKAANTSVYLENLMPSKNINFEVPFKKWLKREPSLKHLQHFGCLAIALKQKLDSKFDEADTIPIESSSTLQNQSNDINIPITQENPSIKQNGSKSTPQNKIFGDVGKPGNILTHQRHPRHLANLADHLSLDPKTYQEAVNQPKSEGWKAEIQSELNNMANHHVWTPTTPDNNVKPLRTTWVFKWETDKDGNLSKFKVRLCVRGFSQKEGIDYTEAFFSHWEIIFPLTSPYSVSYQSISH
ncbi:hypothetical protein O181_000534 [Austropuccinia psidii MF-1]|uniref:Integrase catalytic domain-containing protein n=1 Tax=Austropuccinia psidii MF-1 TaxID=1389203 RepID=A0A9Q3B8P6_9BASI|nr:hypothetical protein [Austropuccinia psidii MF-1]